MYLETAKVIEVKKDLCLVELSLHSGCQSCEVKSQCLQSSSSKVRKLWLSKNKDKVYKEGDLVAIQFRERDNVVLSILLYLFPVIMLILGVFIPYFFENEAGQRELWSIFFGFGGLLFSFFCLKFIGRYKKILDKFKPKII